MLAIRDWLVDKLDWLIPIVAIIVLIAAVTAAIVGGAIMIEGASCRAKAEAMDVNWSYDVWQDCMIVVDGKTIPLSAYQVVKVTQ